MKEKRYVRFDMPTEEALEKLAYCDTVKILDKGIALVEGFRCIVEGLIDKGFRLGVEVK